jgi:hypothetical protein
MMNASATQEPTVVENGKLFLLDCSVTGVPKPEVAWFKVGCLFFSAELVRGTQTSCKCPSELLLGYLSRTLKKYHVLLRSGMR